MTEQEYNLLIDHFTKERRDLSEKKRKDYTVGDRDVLRNFKSVAERAGVDTEQVWLTYFLKHIDSITAYIKNGTESEPIRERFKDAMNYLELGLAILEEHVQEERKQDETKSD